MGEKMYFLEVNSCIGAGLRLEPQSGKDSSPDFILCDRHAERIADGAAELFFEDQFRKSRYLATVSPDPLAPEQHALDIIEPVWPHMVASQTHQTP